MVVKVSPGSSLFIGGDTNTRIVSRLDTGRTELVQFNLIAGQDISGPSQLIDLELKYTTIQEDSLHRLPLCKRCFCL